MAIRHFSLTSTPTRRIYPLGLKFGPCQACRNNIRGFHATSRRCFVDECLVQTHTLINGLHNLTGLPWAASIPLTALFTRALFIFPFACYGRKIALHQRRLAPPMEEATRIAQQKAAQMNPGKSAQEKNKIMHADFYGALRRLLKVLGQLKWHIYSIFMRLSTWLVVMETLRRMAGTEQGILGSSDVAVIPIESSFAAEGMLWFPNLLLPDPSLILPFMLSATLLTSGSFVRLGLQKTRSLDTGIAVRVNQPADGLQKSRLQLVVALAAGPATLQFPSAIMLYWISSELCGIGSKLLMNWWMPWEDTAAPTKRTLTLAKQRFRGATMQDLRVQSNKKKQKPKK